MRFGSPQTSLHNWWRISKLLLCSLHQGLSAASVTEYWTCQTLKEYWTSKTSKGYWTRKTGKEYWTRKIWKLSFGRKLLAVPYLYYNDLNKSIDNYALPHSWAIFHSASSQQYLFNKNVRMKNYPILMYWDCQETAQFVFGCTKYAITACLLRCSQLEIQKFSSNFWECGARCAPYNFLLDSVWV